VTADEKFERELHGLEMIRAGIAQGLEFMPKKADPQKTFKQLLKDLDFAIDVMRDQVRP
jgi:hypothetical protein